MPDVQRSRRVGGHELHLDLAALAESNLPVTLSASQDIRDHSLLRRGREEKIDEACARDLSLGQPRRRRQRSYQCLCDLVRAAPERLGELQRQIGSVVTMPALFGPLQNDSGSPLLWKRGCHGVCEQLCQMASGICDPK